MLKYSKPESELEAKCLFSLIEDLGNRVLVEYMNSGMKINPTFIYLKSDLQPAS